MLIYFTIIWVFVQALDGPEVISLTCSLRNHLPVSSGPTAYLLINVNRALNIIDIQCDDFFDTHTHTHAKAL